MVTINIQPIKLGNLQQYDANALFVQMNNFDSDTMVINVSCGIVNLVPSGSIQVPDSSFSLVVPVTYNMTLQQIIQAVGAAVISYSPLFIKV